MIIKIIGSFTSVNQHHQSSLSLICTFHQFFIYGNVFSMLYDFFFIIFVFRNTRYYQISINENMIFNHPFVFKKAMARSIGPFYINLDKIPFYCRYLNTFSNSFFPLLLLVSKNTAESKWGQQSKAAITHKIAETNSSFHVK